MKFGSNVFRGVWLLARGRAAGIAEFGATTDAFTASLAPLIAFPLVLSMLMALQAARLSSGPAIAAQLSSAGLAFVTQLCVVLVLPVITQAFARFAGKTAVWLRTATALNWSFWICIPLLLVAGFIGAVMVAAGVPEVPAELGLTGAVAVYLLWYHWFTLRAGLGLGGWAAALLVMVTNLAIGLLSAGPALVDIAVTGRLPAMGLF